MRHPRTFVSGIVLFLSCGALAACGGDPGRAASEPAEKTVAIRSFEFRPTQTRIEAGAEVVWVNEDDILHTVTSGTAGEQGVPGVSEDLEPSPDGLFDLDLDGQASTATFAFDEPGTYAYFCAIHSGMSGTVRVA
jgi:plastocyanin